MNNPEDVFDYSMSDDFVSGTRRVPYRTGFQSRHCRGKLPIAMANRLSDRDFKRYIENGCRFPDPEQDLREQLAEQRKSVRVLQLQFQQTHETLRVQALQIEQLRSLLPKVLQASASGSTVSGAGAQSVRGLNVPKR